MEPFDPADVTWQRVSPRLAVARRLAADRGRGRRRGRRASCCWLLAGPAWVLVAVPVLLVGRRLGLVADRPAGRAIGYAERDDDLLVRRGILFRDLVVVPYGRMQYVDVQAGPVDRRFGIAKVQLHTASPRHGRADPGPGPGGGGPAPGPPGPPR